jgi:hypothetical protein
VQDPPEQVRDCDEAVDWLALGPEPEVIEKLEALMIRSNSPDPHLEHFISMVSLLLPSTRISIYSLHFKHLNS